MEAITLYRRHSAAERLEPRLKKQSHLGRVAGPGVFGPPEKTKPFLGKGF
jgi:hypothetical protein